MKVIKQSFYILTPISDDGMQELRFIECAARTCYRSNFSVTNEDCKTFIKGLITRGHEAMLEHGSISVRIVTDRGISHELVRHRIASYAQESTRWCNYGTDKFGNELTFIEPIFKEKEGHLHNIWWHQCAQIEETYLEMLENGWTPQMARSILPNCLKTEIVVTANYREWRNIFRLRCAKDAHPQMRELMLDILKAFRYSIPVIFDDLYEEFYLA